MKKVARKAIVSPKTITNCRSSNIGRNMQQKTALPIKLITQHTDCVVGVGRETPLSELLMFYKLPLSKFSIPYTVFIPLKQFNTEYPRLCFVLYSIYIFLKQLSYP